jgi:hypothetical protein
VRTTGPLILILKVVRPSRAKGITPPDGNVHGGAEPEHHKDFKRSLDAHRQEDMNRFNAAFNKDSLNLGPRPTDTGGKKRASPRRLTTGTGTAGKTASHIS